MVDDLPVHNNFMYRQVSQMVFKLACPYRDVSALHYVPPNRSLVLTVSVCFAVDCQRRCSQTHPPTAATATCSEALSGAGGSVPVHTTKRRTKRLAGW